MSAMVRFLLYSRLSTLGAFCPRRQYGPFHPKRTYGPFFSLHSMTAIHASLNAYLRYLDSPEGRTRTNLNRTQLAEFNQAVHAYAVSKRNSSDNSTMNTRGTELQRQASGSSNNGNPSNAGSNASKISNNQRNRLKAMAAAAEAKAAAKRQANEKKAANDAAIRAARNQAYANKRQVAMTARAAANAARLGQVTKVRALNTAIKKVSANNFNLAKVIRNLKAANANLSSKNNLSLTPANRAKLFNAYTNGNITARNNPALKKALIRAANIKYSSRGASLGNKFARRFGGPSVQGAEAKRRIKGFFSSAPRLSAARNWFATSRAGMSKSKILGGYTA